VPARLGGRAAGLAAEVLGGTRRGDMMVAGVRSGCVERFTTPIRLRGFCFLLA
jgi:hypothetical protein